MTTKNLLSTFVLCICACLCLTAQTINPKFIDGHLYFKFVDSYKINYVVNENTSVEADQLPQFSDLFKKYDVTLITRPLYCCNSEKLARIIRLEFNQAEKIEEFIKELEKYPEVEYAEKIPLPKKKVTYNDPYYSASYLNNVPNQWYLSMINAPQAWDLQSGSPNITIAIVDNAVWGAHEDLNISSSNMCSFSSGTASVGNSAPPTSVTQNTTCSSSDIYNGDCPAYDWSHGTHCAGLAGAINNNNKGISSLGGGCTLMGVRAANNAGYLYYCYNGVVWAVNNGAKIVSMSWGSEESSTSERELMQEIYDYDIILIASAGNEGDEGNPIIYPAGYSSVISVASIDSDGGLSYFSQYGTGRADIAAPGGFYLINNQNAANILSTTYCTCQYWRLSGTSSLNNKYYDGMQGTSMACPVVSGLVGLMASAYPDITPDQVKACLINNATPLTAGSHTITNNAGYINAEASVQCAQILAAGGEIPVGPALEAGWYGNEEYHYLSAADADESIIIRPETYGNYDEGYQITKVKFGTYEDSRYPSYNNNDFIIKIYEGSSINNDITTDGYTGAVSSCLGTLVYTQNYTQTSAGIQIVDLNTPYTIGEDDFWIMVEAVGPTLFLFEKDNESGNISASNYSQDLSVASGHYLYQEIDDDDNNPYLYLNYGAAYTDNSQNYITEYGKEYVLAYYLSDGSVYTENSDLYTNAYDANGNAITSVSLSDNDDLTFIPTLGNAGPDMAADSLTLSFTVNGVVLDEFTTDSLNMGEFYIIGGDHSYTITADILDSLGFVGAFNVCVEVTYNGSDPDLTNNSYCISVVRTTSDPTYIIATACTPANAGTLTGAGTYISGTNVTVTATPNSGYAFDKWTEGSNTVSTSPTYSFTINANRTLTAHFNVVTPDTYVVTTSVTPANSGRTSGAGSYVDGLSVTVNAIANTGYVFDKWTENGTTVSTNNSYTFTIHGNRDLVAHFNSSAPDTYTVTTTSNPSNGGTTTGAGTYNAGDNVTVTATANNGFTFNKWTENGNTVSTNASYSFTINANQDLVAHFIANTPDSYTVTTTANPSNGGTTTGAGTYNAGDNVTVTATANNGFTFNKWTENGNTVSTNASYSFTINANRNLVAHFNSNSPDTYSITAIVNGAGGTINPSGTVSVNANSNKTFTMTPDNGFHIQTVKADGVDVTNDLIGNTYTFYNVTTDHTLVVTFATNVGINNYNTAQVVLFPNPNNGSFSLKTNLSGKFTYQLFDAKGALLDRRELDSNNQVLNFNYHLTTGLYFIRIISDQQSWTERVVIK